MPESYSVNHLKTWQQCQKKYELALVRQLKWPSNPKNFRLGKGVHQLLDFTAHELPVNPIIEDCDTDIRQVWGTLQHSHWAKLPVIASEWGFSLCFSNEPNPSRWIYGRIDRIVEEDSNHIAILDWKTGTRIPDHVAQDWQTRIYLYAVYLSQYDLNLSVSFEQLSMVYVQAKEGSAHHVRVPYSRSMHEETTQILTQTFSALDSAKQDHHFQLPRRCPDTHCPYRPVCGIETASIPIQSDPALADTPLSDLDAYNDLLPF